MGGEILNILCVIGCNFMFPRVQLRILQLEPLNVNVLIQVFCPPHILRLNRFIHCITITKPKVTHTSSKKHFSIRG